jgi:hypothetical protein
MTLRIIVAIPLWVSLFAGSALAKESEGPTDVEPFRPVPEIYSKFTYRPIAIQLRLGLDTLVGLFGLTASYDIENHFAIGAGFGTNEAGLQLAAFARARPFVWFYHQSTLIALALEGGYSTGPGVDPFPIPNFQDVSPSGTLHWRRISWLQGEVVFELRTHSGFSLTVGIGKAVPVHFQGTSCTGDSGWCSDNANSKFGVLWTQTTGVGYAF